MDEVEGTEQEAYPHVCGATAINDKWTAILAGLSPRVWGNRHKKKTYQKKSRPIPTCVGQPVRLFHCHECARAYPHVCGATLFRKEDGHIVKGLSPRVWGNRSALYL